MNCVGIVKMWCALYWLGAHSTFSSWEWDICVNWRSVGVSFWYEYSSLKLVRQRTPGSTSYPVLPSQIVYINSLSSKTSLSHFSLHVSYNLCIINSLQS